MNAKLNSLVDLCIVITVLISPKITEFLEGVAIIAKDFTVFINLVVSFIGLITVSVRMNNERKKKYNGDSNNNSNK